ncbi:MAG: single-stranded-DNA-specific exonuclease RecJ [bacterium]|nr:single-stranded-DNA-specific exonuclease RecJ [bacterium]
MYNSVTPHDLLATLLQNRGITGEQEKIFLSPDFDRDLHDPYLYNDMAKAVERICKAVRDDERIIVYGDYDCDGIPGSVVLHDFFAKAGYGNVEVYIPHRHKEGYGLNKEAIAGFKKDGVSLVITVDSGITDVEEVVYAHECGIDVIITDHHLPQDILPPAFAILNAKRVDNTYPDPWLCGAGVAFKLVQALVKEEQFGIPPGWEKWLLDVVGIATIADMVPLVGENRALAHFGLRVLRKTRRPGLLQLLRGIRLAPEVLGEENVGFDIGPRINAASRLDIPMNAFRLLATKDVREGGLLASHLEALNIQRKKLVADALCEAEKLEIGDESVVVIGSHEWPVGIVGLIAGRLVERFARPVFVWGSGDGGSEVKGSCRSDGSVNLVALMEAAQPGTFSAFGGHEGAGGFSLNAKNVDELLPRLIRAHAEIPVKEAKEAGEVHIDGELDVAHVNESLMRTIERCGPFGEGNPRPHFLFNRVKVIHSELFGKTKGHVKLQVGAGSRGINCIKFFEDQLPKEQEVSFVGTIERSYFAGRYELRIRIHSFV